MKEKPIIFTAESVNAIRDRRKTQTRRVMKIQPEFRDGVYYWPTEADIAAYGTSAAELNQSIFRYAPYKVGDRLWVREAFYCDDLDYPNGMLEEMLRCLYYRADGDCCSQIPECQCAYFGGVRWKSPLFMPRWASRLTLEVTAVRVERLQDISEEDAKAEGVAFSAVVPTAWDDKCIGRSLHEQQGGSYLAGFYTAWEKLNGKRSPWQSNSWVWVVEFQRVGL